MKDFCLAAKDFEVGGRDVVEVVDGCVAREERLWILWLGNMGPTASLTSDDSIHHSILLLVCRCHCYNSRDICELLRKLDCFLLTEARDINISECLSSNFKPDNVSADEIPAAERIIQRGFRPRWIALSGTSAVHARKGSLAPETSTTLLLIA